MKNFIGSMALPGMNYHRPRELGDALNLIDGLTGEFRIVAGCTDFIPAIRRGAWSFKEGLNVIDISRIEGLDSIRQDGEIIRIGAATRLADLVQSPIVREHAFLLSDAVNEMASLQIRNRATIGGNLCTASPAADTAPPLLVLDAKVKIERANSERLVPLQEFFKGPGKTILDRREMITEIQVPILKPDEKAFRMKLGRRNSFTLSVVSVATCTKIINGCFSTIKIALGAVAPTPMRAKKSESFLVRNEVSEKVIDEGAAIASKEANPISDVRASAGYRKDMVYVLTRKMLLPLLSDFGLIFEKERNQR